MKMQLLALLLMIAPSAPAGDEKAYGNDIALEKKTAIADILSSPDLYNGKKVLVEGPVVDVCPARGCWIKIGSNKEFESIRLKVDDGEIIFPMDAKGKNVLAEGTVSVKTISKEEQIKQGEYYAKEEGTTFDPSSVKGPKTIIQIKGSGAIIK